MSATRLFIPACIALFFLTAQLQADPLAERLGRLFDGVSSVFQDEEFLDPEKAFILTSEVTSSHRITLDWQIAEGYYLYRDNFSFKSQVPGITLLDITLPEGELKQDPEFGPVKVFHHGVRAVISLSRQKTTTENVVIEVVYQGCKEGSICYPPIRKSLTLHLPEFDRLTGEPVDAAADKSLQLSEQDTISRNLHDRNIFLNMLAFFGFGLLLSLTPCIFPMIPILSGIIIGRDKTLTALHGLFLSIAYVFAMAVTYALLGIIAGAFKLNLQAAAQNIWVLTGFSLVFVLLALSMFGFYELQLPASWRDRLTALSHKHKQGSLISAAMMGLLSAIIVGPCVAPPLAGALLYITQTGNAVLGGAALFSMGLGMGVPLLLIGASLGGVLPKAGAWMVAIKKIFGVMLMGVAIWFMSRVLPPPVSLLLWGTLFIVCAIYLGALDWRSVRSGWFRLWQGLGVIMLLYGAMLIIGAAAGHGDLLRPLAFHPGDQASKVSLQFKRIKSIEDLERELEQSSREGKTVMLDFYADWCISCKEMEYFTFSKPEVQAAMSDMVLLQADVTANDEIDKALLNHFSIIGPPAILFFREGREVENLRLFGFKKANDFIAHIARLDG